MSGGIVEQNVLFMSKVHRLGMLPNQKWFRGRYQTLCLCLLLNRMRYLWAGCTGCELCVIVYLMSLLQWFSQKSTEKVVKLISILQLRGGHTQLRRCTCDTCYWRTAQEFDEFSNQQHGSTVGQAYTHPTRSSGHVRVFRPTQQDLWTL